MLKVQEQCSSLFKCIYIYIFFFIFLYIIWHNFSRGLKLLKIVLESWFHSWKQRPSHLNCSVRTEVFFSSGPEYILFWNFMTVYFNLIEETLPFECIYSIKALQMVTKKKACFQCTQWKALFYRRYCAYPFRKKLKRCSFTGLSSNLLWK